LIVFSIAGVDEDFELLGHGVFSFWNWARPLLVQALPLLMNKDFELGCQA
jgi:hypothetical protein